MFKLSKKVVISEFLPKIFILNAGIQTRLVRRIFLYFHQLVNFSQGEFEGVFPKDLRRRGQNSDSNKIWRTFLAQIDRKYCFGAE